MRYLAGLLVLTALVIAGCGDTPDSQLINDAQESVKKELAKKYKPGECQKWQFMESSGVIKAGASKLVCDGAFNVDKGLSFSEEKVYRRDGFNAVCGKVSGYTDVGKISGEYIFTDKQGDNVTIKTSKSELAMVNNEDSRKLQKLYDDLFNLQMKNCK
ncbi:TPA: hypothetical protein ACPY23_002426 [Klebsiella oxytoca]|uniref:hypothetical protein n=1 Tax=Klebsiella TaxID=570 RepID=UPI000B4213BB|nr:hypothetical protein [Klebsiella pneumoniae]EKW3298591.1 hypothetical protein [Klebsiella oxytoca]EKU7855357.1 hypothetical protein [Klebsiella pneumoniae]EKX6631450.1 hypothetical protein [Klebsiella pneumoniae]EKZ6572002.1 hypothetical protein [Klebsiella pneumoniae]EKZ6833437.1 hypothetical protein [Klebsiella pneumoniae]